MSLRSFLYIKPFWRHVGLNYWRNIKTVLTLLEWDAIRVYRDMWMANWENYLTILFSRLLNAWMELLVERKVWRFEGLMVKSCSCKGQMSKGQPLHAWARVWNKPVRWFYQGQLDCCKHGTEGCKNHVVFRGTIFATLVSTADRKLHWSKLDQYDNILARWFGILCHHSPLQTGSNVSSCSKCSWV